MNSPLCRSHRRALHRHGDEAAWWESNKVDPVAVAHELWQRTRLDGPRGGRTEALLSVDVIECRETTERSRHRQPRSTVQAQESGADGEKRKSGVNNWMP
jgi:hypothetical protein